MWVEIQVFPPSWKRICFILANAAMPPSQSLFELLEEVGCVWNKPVTGYGLEAQWSHWQNTTILLSFSQQNQLNSKVWSQKITIYIKWIQAFQDKYSMWLFQNKMTNSTEKMVLLSI